MRTGAAVLALDVGGTKLAAGIVDATTADVRRSLRAPTPTGGAEASIATMIALARELLEHESAGMIGVSFGGPVHQDGRTVRRSMHIAGWDDLPLADRLARELGLSAAVANDGDAAALGEARFGAGRGVRNLVYVTVSTGIGGGIVLDGRLYRGERAWAGEIGHLVLDPSGPVCSCGRLGCLEALASGTAIAREARRRSMPADSTAREVAQAAADGDVTAAEIWAGAMDWLGLGIASAANLLDPGRVVLGGGLTDAGAQLFDPVRETVAVRALDPELEVVPTALGTSVGLVGAAAVAIAAAG